jgi:hypothetical protein
MDFFTEAVGKAFVVVLVIVVIIIIFAFPTMWLWNWLMPEIFNLSEITIWQALGLNLLSGILFKSTTTINKK